MRGNHYTGLPVALMLDDVESYRWPLEFQAQRLESGLREVVFETSLRVPGYVSQTLIDDRQKERRDER